MLSTLSFLIYGESTEKPNRKLKDLACLYLVNKNNPIRDENGNPLSTEQLRMDLNRRLVDLKLSNFQIIIDKTLDRLESIDESLLHFVLVSTYRISDHSFEKSLKETSVKQNLMTNRFEYNLYSELIENSSKIPQLPWDISRVLDSTKIGICDDKPTPSYLDNVTPIDEWGLISKEYREILKSEEILCNSREGRPIVFFHFKESIFFENLLNMYRGRSSDVFQVNEKEHFYQSLPCRVEDWNLTTTKTILSKHLHLGNLLSDTRKNLKKLFKSATENSIRIIIQTFLTDEMHKFWKMLGVYQFETNNRFEKCQMIYNLVCGHYHVLQESITILKNLNDYSPIGLNEMAFVGSRAAPYEYSKKMWRRFNIVLMQFIISKCADILTSPDAELFDLLVDEGDAKFIKDASVWQRLNPLSMESSRCIDRKLSNRLVDLIICYRFYVNDKKNNRNFDYTDNEDVHNADELELFAITPQFKKMLAEIMSFYDVENTSNSEELNESLDILISRLPTTKLVEKYSRIVLDKSIKFFDFLKQFFTQTHIHGDSMSNISLGKYEKHGFDRAFLKAISYDARSTFDDCRFTISPKEPLNVYATESVSTVYSQVFTVLNMLKDALNAIIETRRCDTFKRELRLRYNVFHMNAVVFTIRKNIMGLIESAFVSMKKKISEELSNESLNCNEGLRVCYRAHRLFVRETAAILMLSLNRGSTSRILKMLVTSVSESSSACLLDDAVSADRHYQEFLRNLSLFLDLCRQDRVRYSLYRSLELCEDSTDSGRKSTFSSYSDDISCRSY